MRVRFFATLLVLAGSLLLAVAPASCKDCDEFFCRNECSTPPPPGWEYDGCTEYPTGGTCQWHQGTQKMFTWCDR